MECGHNVENPFAHTTPEVEEPQDEPVESPRGDGKPVETEEVPMNSSEVTLSNNKANTNGAIASSPPVSFDRELQDHFERAGHELLGAVSAEECSTIEDSLAMIMVPRLALLAEAWAEGPISKVDEVMITTTTMPPLPCILWAYGTATPPQLLSKRGLGRDMKIKPGTHAFVKMPGESSLRVSTLTCAFGEAMGHPQMSGEQPVEAAGEVEIDAEGQLVRWNNLSGTYKVPKQLAFQAPAAALLRHSSDRPEPINPLLLPPAAVSHAHDSALALAAGGTSTRQVLGRPGGPWAR
jgi:hypothetical protein